MCTTYWFRIQQGGSIAGLLEIMQHLLVRKFVETCQRDQEIAMLFKDDLTDTSSTTEWTWHIKHDRLEALANGLSLRAYPQAARQAAEFLSELPTLYRHCKYFKGWVLACENDRKTKWNATSCCLPFQIKTVLCSNEDADKLYPGIYWIWWASRALLSVSCKL